MFFENPFDAFQNIHSSMKTNGSLHFVCWTDLMKNEFFIEGMEIITKYTQEDLPEITKKPGPFAFNDGEYIKEILEFSGFKNINVDKVYTSISTKDSVRDNVNILMGIGPRAKILSEKNLSSEKLLIVKNEMVELCKKRRVNDVTNYKACINYVSAIK